VPRNCSKNARNYVQEVKRLIPTATEHCEPYPAKPGTLGYRIRLGADGPALTVVCKTQTAAWVSCYTRHIKGSDRAQTSEPMAED